MTTEIERWDPFREMTRLRNRLDHLIGRTFTHPPGEWLATIFGYPALDIYEIDGKIKVDVPLPGVKPEEVELTTTGNTLTIKGERKAKEEVKEADYYRHEMHYGAFTRAVTLPKTVDAKHPEAVFENGVLTVSFPKTATTAPTRIAIKATEPKGRHVG